MENLLDFTHAATGLPWYGTVALVTVLTRLALLPLVVKTMRNSVLMHNLRPEMEVRTHREHAPCAAVAER